MPVWPAAVCPRLVKRLLEFKVAGRAWLMHFYYWAREQSRAHFVAPGDLLTLAGNLLYYGNVDDAQFVVKSTHEEF